MLDFEFQNSTKIKFGKNSLDNLDNEILKYGNKILLATGSGSIKKIGLYDKVKNTLKNSPIEIYELDGIEPNPKLSSVQKGIEICKKNDIDFILAVGGGSVIDAAKGIAVGALTDEDIWDFYLKKKSVSKALPVGTILTLAATGSEMNKNSVVTNWETKEKLHIGSPVILPKFSILNPEYTCSVPVNHTIYGCVDIMAHVFEQYFSNTKETPLQDRFFESVLATTIENTYRVLKSPEDYDTRANIMWCGTMALNSILGLGKASDWSSHIIEHEISAIYDISHGAGLAIVFPNWMKYVLDTNIPIFKQYALNVWNISDTNLNDKEIALKGISKTKEFFKEIGAPTALSDVNIDNKHLKIMAKNAVRYGEIGSLKKLNENDILNILQMSL